MPDENIESVNETDYICRCCGAEFVISYVTELVETDSGNVVTHYEQQGEYYTFGSSEAEHTNDLSIIDEPRAAICSDCGETIQELIDSGLLPDIEPSAVE